MEKVLHLRERRAALKAAGASVRAQIDAIFDRGSFVELAAFSFSKSDLYREDALGEGVVTGFATIEGHPFYLVAQNYEVCLGGLSKANCEKIAKTLNAAEKNRTPVVYLLHSQGVRVGEGVNVLEGIAELLLKATQLKGSVPQYAVLCGEVYGSAAALAAVCDFVFFMKESALCVNSPLVLSARSGKNLKKEEVGGYAALRRAGLPAILAEDAAEVSRTIARLSSLLAEEVVEAELNEPVPAFNEKADAASIVSAIEDAIEIGANSYPQVRTVLGRIGGIAVAAIVFDRAAISAGMMKKVRDFAELACCYSVPLVTFVDCTGIEGGLEGNDSAVLKEIAEYLSILDAIDTAKIAVVTGRAVGLGYSLFAAKSAGFDYTLAFADAHIALFESATGAEIEFAGQGNGDKQALARRYAAENADAFNAAKGGYLDDVIEPQFVRQHLIACLQTLIG